MTIWILYLGMSLPTHQRFGPKMLSVLMKTISIVFKATFQLYTLAYKKRHMGVISSVTDVISDDFHEVGRLVLNLVPPA